jgi:hypothetical protein
MFGLLLIVTMSQVPEEGTLKVRVVCKVDPDDVTHWSHGNVDPGPFVE